MDDLDKIWGEGPVEAGDDFDAIWTAPPPKHGYLNNLAREAAQGLSFGFADELGLDPPDDVWRATNPGTSALSYGVGSLAPSLIPGAAFAHAGKAGQAARWALTPSATTGYAGAAGQGIKLGATYGGLHGAGNASDVEGDSWGEELAARGEAALKGGAAGAAAGAVLGPAIEAAGRFAGAAGQRLSPAMRDARRMMRDPESAGLSAILKDARRDGIDFDALYNRMTPKTTGATITRDQLEAVMDGIGEGLTNAEIAARAGITVPTVRNWRTRIQDKLGPDFEGLSLLEAAKVPRVVDPVGGGRSQIVTTKNLDDLADYAANTPGEGQNIARMEMLGRKADQPDVIDSAISKYFGTADDFRAHTAGRRSEGMTAFHRAYDELHNSGVVPDLAITPSELHPLIADPAFQSAISFANRRARLAGEPEFGVNELMTPRVVDYIQRSLRAAGSNQGEEAALARELRSRYLEIVDKHFSGFPQLRNMYRGWRQELEAYELGRAMSPFAKDTGKTGDAIDKMRELRKKARGSGDSAVMARSALQAIREGFGQSIRDLADVRNPMTGGVSSALDKLMSRNAKRRIIEVLGDADGKAFLRMMIRERRKIETGQTLYGNSKTAPRERKGRMMENVGEMASGIVTINPGRVSRGIGGMINEGLTERSMSAVNRTLSETDMMRVRRMIRQLRDANRGYRQGQAISGRARQLFLPPAGAEAGAFDTQTED